MKKCNISVPYDDGGVEMGDKRENKSIIFRMKFSFTFLSIAF